MIRPVMCLSPGESHGVGMFGSRIQSQLFEEKGLDLYLPDLGLYREERLISCLYEFSWNDGCHPPSSHVLELVLASRFND